jgi:hypothetical protein
MYFNKEFKKNKKTRKTTTTIFFYLKWNYPKNVFLIFFNFDKLAKDYHLLLSSKPLEGHIFCLENIDF